MLSKFFCLLGVDLDETPKTIGTTSWKDVRKSPLGAYTTDEMCSNLPQPWKTLYKHVVIPQEEEIAKNPRSRSAKLRCAIKISDSYCK